MRPVSGEMVSVAVPLTTMLLAVVVVLFAGAVIVTTGVLASCVDEAVLPKALVAVPSVAVPR
jgi:hypothetical protein